MRKLLLGIASGAALMLPGCLTLDDLLSDSDPMPAVYVQDYGGPVFYDPYYQQVKVYRPPVQLYESKTKKTKGNRVYETTTVRNQWGNIVYEDTSSRKRKTKKKK